jgi:hypothetical protein
MFRNNLGWIFIFVFIVISFMVALYFGPDKTSEEGFIIPQPTKSYPKIIILEDRTFTPTEEQINEILAADREFMSAPDGGG